MRLAKQTSLAGSEVPRMSWSNIHGVTKSGNSKNLIRQDCYSCGKNNEAYKFMSGSVIVCAVIFSLVPIFSGIFFCNNCNSLFKIGFTA